MNRRIALCLLLVVACAPEVEPGPDAGEGAVDAGPPVRSALSICLGDGNGSVDTSKCTSLNASPPVIPTLDFGTTEGPAVQRSLVLVNTGADPLPVAFATFVHAEFTLLTEIPASLPPSIPVTLIVQFQPTDGGRASSRFVLTSSDAAFPSLSIDAVARVAGVLCEVPTSVELGAVEVGESNAVTFTIRNCGLIPQALTALDFGAGSNASLSAGPLGSALPATIATGDSLNVRVTFAPTVAGETMETTLQLTGLDPPTTLTITARALASCEIATQVSVGVTPSAAQPPGATHTLTATGTGPLSDITWTLVSQPQGSNATLSSLSGPTVSLRTDLIGTYEVEVTATDERSCLSPPTRQSIVAVDCAGPNAPVARITETPRLTVRPLDTVTLSGGNSTAIQPGALTYQWRLVSQPPGGSVSISPGSSVDKQLFAELAGTYEVELVVTDAAQCSSAPARATILSRPPGRLLAELTWPQAYGDVDLHLLGPNGAFYDSRSDCHWLNCKPIGSPPRPQLKWGGGANRLFDDGIAANDPRLTVDALWGNGPEEIEIDVPFDGTYTLVASYYCDSDGAFRPPNTTVTAQARVLVDATVALEVTKSLVQSDIWEVAQVVVTGGVITVVPLSTPLRKATGGMQSCR